MLLDKRNQFPQLEMMNHSWRISVRLLLQIAIVFSLMYSGNLNSHAFVPHSGATKAHDINHGDHHANSLDSAIHMSDGDTSSEHSEYSKHLGVQGYDTDSCCQAFCASFYLEEFSELENFSIRDIHLLVKGRATYSNRLDIPHRPPNA